jgi:hypothetical protein
VTAKIGLAKFNRSIGSAQFPQRFELIIVERQVYLFHRLAHSGIRESLTFTKFHHGNLNRVIPRRVARSL